VKKISFYVNEETWEKAKEIAGPGNLSRLCRIFLATLTGDDPLSCQFRKMFLLLARDFVFPGTKEIIKEGGEGSDKMEES